MRGSAATNEDEVMIPQYLLIDLFCGAGGTTTGAEASGVCKVIAAVNHDPMAIASHAANHEGVQHFTEDIRTLNLSKLIEIVKYWKAIYPKAKLILWLSLECTNFSKAKGGLPRDADSRTLAEHANRYIEALNPDKVMIENVEEFLSWGPLCENGKPISRKNGRDYLRWVKSITALGYKWDWRILNSADYGAYTSRRRLFGIFHREEVAIWPQPTHVRKPQIGQLFAEKQYAWKAVADVLDLGDLGSSIFARPKPLVDNTLHRILRGLNKYILPMLQSYYGNGSSTSMNEPAHTLTTKDRLAMVTPIQFIDRDFISGGNSSIESPAGSITTVPKLNLCTAFLVNPQYNNVGNDISKPAPTIIASQKSYPLSLAVARVGEEGIQDNPTDTDAMRELKAFMRTHGIVDIYLRMLNVQELKRIQGFPETYELKGSQELQKKFIGNSVVPQVVSAWLRAMAHSKKAEAA
jgi:DNA (cytosine-5)-methyltransferase 1